MSFEGCEGTRRRQSIHTRDSESTGRRARVQTSSRSSNIAGSHVIDHAGYGSRIRDQPDPAIATSHAWYARLWAAESEVAPHTRVDVAWASPSSAASKVVEVIRWRLPNLVKGRVVVEVEIVLARDVYTHALSVQTVIPPTLAKDNTALGDRRRHISADAQGSRKWPQGFQVWHRTTKLRRATQSSLFKQSYHPRGR